MRVLKNLKSLFIVESHAQEANPAGEISGSKETSNPVKVMPEAQDSIPSQANPASPNERFLGVLLSALEENNVEGFDYLEFREALRSLRDMPMDEPTRFKSAFAMAQTMKATSDVLLRSARVYLQVLQKEDTKFGEALTNREQTEIHHRQNLMANLDKDIQQKQAQIEGLMGEITKARDQMKRLQEELIQVHVKMDETRNNFESAYQFLANEIGEDLRKMEQYLK